MFRRLVTLAMMCAVLAPTTGCCWRCFCTNGSVDVSTASQVEIPNCSAACVKSGGGGFGIPLHTGQCTGGEPALTESPAPDPLFSPAAE